MWLSKQSLRGRMLLAAGSLFLILASGTLLTRSSKHIAASTYSTGDRALDEWVSEWRRDRKRGEATRPQSQVALRNILSKTNLSCATLVEVGRQMHVDTDDDLTTAIVYAAASRRGDSEL